MRQIPTAYLDLVTRHASDGVLDGDHARVAGWIYTESGFDPWAVRYEPAFHARYVMPIAGLSETERIMRSTSWGLLQIMGQVARENGFTGKWLPALCEPAANVNMAVKILRKNKVSAGSWDGALAAYNGGLGGNRTPPYRNQFYVDKVNSHAEHYRP